MEQGRKNITLYINIEFTQMLKKKLPQFEKHISCWSVSELTRPSVCLPFKNLNDDFQFSKLSVKRDLENELMVAGGEGIVREFVMAMHTLYLK